MPDDPKPAGDQNAQPTTGDASGQPGGNANAGNGGQGNDDKKFTQAELDAHIKARLDQAQRNAEAKAQKDREAAEAKALEEQSKFKELADQRATKIAELEPLGGRLKEAEDALSAILEQERKGMPAHITSLLDGLTPAAQLTWIAANREALATGDTGQKNGNGTATRSVPATPKPAAPVGRADIVRQETEQLRASGRYTV